MSDLITMMSAAAGQGGINPREHFNTVLYTGNGSTQSITGVGFQPDLFWAKCRSAANNNILYDAVRGVSQYLSSNLTVAEGTAPGVTSFDSDGVTVGSDPDSNQNSQTYVAWSWKGGGTGVSNTDGTISSTVSANTTAGISILTATTPASYTSYTAGHGLGVTPAMIIYKERSGTANWWVWHQSFATASHALNLNTTGAIQAGAYFGTQTSTVAGFQAGLQTGLSVGFVAYCFAEVEGFSKFGSYTGNGSATGPSVTTDFEPTWLLIKRTDTTGDWILLDSARDATNPRTAYLEPNTFDAEATGNDVDFNATGFQLKSTSASVNASGGTYIYACFA